MKIKIGERVKCILPSDNLINMGIYTIKENIVSNFGNDGVVLFEISPTNKYKIGYKSERFKSVDIKTNYTFDI